MSNTNHLAIINGLRGFAAMIVCFFHFTWHTDPTGEFLPEGNWLKEVGYFGLNGVNVFFVISGLVIPLALFHGKYRFRDFFRFMAKRMVRLHPPYLASMLVLGIFTVGYAIKDKVMPEVDVWRMVHHFFLTAPFAHAEWYQHVYWTLAIEFQYYLFIGLMFPVLMAPQRWVRTLFLAAFILSSWCFGHDAKHYLFFHAPVFAAGIVLFWYIVKEINTFELLVWSVICVVVTRYEVSPHTAWFVVGTIACAAWVRWESSITNWLGDISYSVYLIHGFTGGQFLWFTAQYAETWPEQVGLLIAAFVVTLALSHLFWRIIEVPSIRWSKKIRYH